MSSPTVVDVSARPPGPRAHRRPHATEGSGRRSAVAVVVAGYVAVVSSLALAGLLLTHVLVHGAVGRWDDDATRWLSFRRHGVLDGVTGVLSRSADTLGILTVAVIVLVVLWRRHRPDQMAVLATGLVLELSAFLAINALVGRDRPAVARLGSTPSTGSFPSGHTAATLVLYVAIAFFVNSSARAVVWRALAWLAAAVMPVAVGFSRVYRGFHHPTDVVFGYLLGCAVLAVTMVAVWQWGPVREDTR